MSASRLAAVSFLLGIAFVPAVHGAQSLSLRERLADDYVALRERPLFAPDRAAPLPIAPPEPEPVIAEPEPLPEPPPPVASAPDWQLVGVVRSEAINSATFTAPGAQAAFTLNAGESRDGWTLKQVGRFDVQLDGAGGRAVLRFSDTASGDTLMPGMEMVDPGTDPAGAPMAVPQEELPVTTESPTPSGEQAPPGANLQ